MGEALSKYRNEINGITIDGYTSRDLDDAFWLEEVMVEKFALIFNKANYSPVIEGHYALNLPAYTHFTSPIRRYADLVNLRQLSAYISGEDLPYSFNQLQEIAEHINAITLKYKEEKNKCFKAQNYRKNMEFLIRENFSDVEDRDYYHLIKMVIEEERLTDKLKDEILFRMETAKDEFEGFYSGKNYTGVLNELCQKNKWLYAKFKYELSGQDHQPEISAIAIIEINGIKYLSDKMIATNKKQAKNMASYSLLEKITHLKPDIIE